MERLDDRLTIVLLSMVLGMTILSVLCYATIFIQPNIPFNPLSPQRATDTAATAIAKLPTSTPIPIERPDQTYPPTWTPSPTRTPGPTKTTTQTRTPTPTKNRHPYAHAYSHPHAHIYPHSSTPYRNTYATASALSCSFAL